MPVSTSPSFMSRLGGMMPGMLNSMASQYGNPNMRGMVDTAGMMSRMFQNRPRHMPQATPGINQMPGQQMPPPQIPQGIDTGPSPAVMGMGRLPMNNGGVAGGIFNRPQGYERPNFGGIFGNYGGGMRPSF